MGNFKESDYFKSNKIIENAKIGSVLGCKKLSELKEKRIEEYNKNPRLCIFCDKKLDYNKKINKFCSSSCSASFNNSKRILSENTKNKISKSLLNKKNKSDEKLKNDIFKNNQKIKILSENNEQNEKISNGLKKAWEEKREVFSCGEKHSKIIGKITKGKYKNDITSIKQVSPRTTSKILKRLKISCCICYWNEGSCDIHHINGKKIDNYDEHFNLTYICPNCHRLVHEGKIDKTKLIPLNDILPKNWTDLYYG
jgi:predicted HNH restriction endonuclease